MWTWGLNVVHVLTVYDTGTRDKKHISWSYKCKCDLPLSLAPVWLCGYCFNTLKQLLHLSITFVPLMFQTPELWCSSPYSPTPPTYHIHTVYCSETPKSKCSNPHPLYPHTSLFGNSSITVFQRPYSHIISSRNCSVADFRNNSQLDLRLFSVKLGRMNCSKSKALGNSYITTFQPPHIISPLITKMKMFQPFLPYHIRIHKTA